MKDAILLHRIALNVDARDKKHSRLKILLEGVMLLQGVFGPELTCVERLAK